MFNRDVEGRISQPLQEELLKIADPLREAQYAGEQAAFDIARKMGAIDQYGPAEQELLGRMITGQEDVAGPLGIIAAEQRARGGQERFLEQSAGIPTGGIPDYLRRQKYQFEPTPGFEDVAGMPGSAKGISPLSVSQIGREKIFDVPGGYGAINKMVGEERISGPFRTMAEPGRMDTAREAATVLKEYLKWTPEDTRLYGELWLRKTSGQPLLNLQPYSRVDPEVLQGLAPRGQLLPNEEVLFQSLQDRVNQSHDLANWLKNLDPKYAALSPEQLPTGAAKLPFFDPDVLKMVAQRTTASGQTILRAKAIMSALAKDARPAADAPLDWISAKDVLTRAGLTGADADPSMKEMLESLGKVVPAGGLETVKVSRQLANDITGYVTPYVRPTALDPFIKTIDTIQSLFKAGITAIWPKKYVRDFTQGAFQNFTAMRPDEWIKYQTDATKFIRRGGTIDYANQIPGLENLSPEAATKKLADEFASLDGFYTGKFTRHAEEAGVTPYTPKKLPGEGREGVLDIITPTAGRETTWNPLDIAGVWGRTEMKFAPVVAGGKISELIDDTNKFALYLQRRASGYVPAAAWEDVVKRHYDFGNLTGFERSVMRRIIPFYSWMRQNVPSTVKRLIEQPGGAEALTAKAIASQRSEEFIPEFIGEGLAIPIGEEREGIQRFLSRTGLPFEDALKILGDIGTIKMLGETTPIIKGPLELATGTQLHTGRPLEDIRSLTGSRILDEALEQSPASRAISTGKKFVLPFTSPRPGVPIEEALLTAGFNALAPASITGVEMQPQRERAIRQVVEEHLKDAPNVGSFERFYVKPENVANLTPEQTMLMRAYQSSVKKSEAKSRAKNIGIKKRRESAESIRPYNLD